MSKQQKTRTDDLPTRLYEVRTARELSLRTLGQLAEVTYTTIRSIEQEQYRAACDVVERLANALNISPAWLAYGIGPKDPDQLPPIEAPKPPRSKRLTPAAAVPPAPPPVRRHGRKPPPE